MITDNAGIDQLVIIQTITDQLTVDQSYWRFHWPADLFEGGFSFPLPRGCSDGALSEMFTSIFYVQVNRFVPVNRRGFCLLSGKIYISAVYGPSPERTCRVRKTINCFPVKSRYFHLKSPAVTRLGKSIASRSFNFYFVCRRKGGSNCSLTELRGAFDDPFRVHGNRIHNEHFGGEGISNWCVVLSDRSAVAKKGS